MNTCDELEAVKEVVNRYIEGSYKADIPLLKRVFHEDARMAGYLGKDLLFGGPEPFFDNLQSRPSMYENGDPYRAEIVHIQVTQRIANVILYEKGFFGSAEFENHFHLIKDGSEEWKIISKTFTTL